MMNEYRYNTKFRKIVDEYCVDNECSLEEAFETDQIKSKFWMYTEM